MSIIKRRVPREFRHWDFKKWALEIDKAKKNLESKNKIFISIDEEKDRIKKQELAAWRYQTLIQTLRYVIGERDTPPRIRDARDYVKPYKRYT